MRHAKFLRVALSLLGVILVLAACKEPNAPDPAPPAGAAMGGDARAEGAPMPSGEGTLVPWEKCNLETVDGRVFASEPVQVGAETQLRGWLLLSADAVPGSAAVVLVGADGAVAGTYPISIALERPDAAAATGSADPNLGFQADLALTDLPAGEYRLFLRHATADGLLACDNGRRIRR